MKLSGRMQWATVLGSLRPCGGRARLSQRAARDQRSAGFSPLRLTTKGAVKSAQSWDRAVKRAEARAPQLSENLRKNAKLSDICIQRPALLPTSTRRAGTDAPCRRGLAMLMVFAWSLAGSALELGETAPAIKTAEWLRGGPVSIEGARGSNVLVLDFWATIPHCRDTIPYLGNLQKGYRDRGVVIIGINSDAPQKTKKFLASLGPAADYAMALDLNHQTTDAYLAGTVPREDLPHAFVIDKSGKVVWHGNSTVALDKILGQVLDGSFQLESARRTVAAEKLIRQYFQLANTGVKNQRTSELGQQIIANASGYASILNEFAWRILKDRRVKARDYDLALNAARAAYELSGGNQVPIIDTYARALFETGRRSEAIELEKKAIAQCKDTRFRPELESVLMRFERLSREKPLNK